jgi:hypothetical protein
LSPCSRVLCFCLSWPSCPSPGSQRFLRASR